MRNATLQEAFESAIVDGINMFVREGIEAKGFIISDGMDKLGDQESLDLKHKIAQEIAQRWVIWHHNFGFQESSARLEI